VPGALSTNIHFAAQLARNRNQVNYSQYLNGAEARAPDSDPIFQM
jgi:hypothetical protein